MKNKLLLTILLIVVALMLIAAVFPIIKMGPGDYVVMVCKNGFILMDEVAPYTYKATCWGGGELTR